MTSITSQNSSWFQWARANAFETPNYLLRGAQNKVSPKDPSKPLSELDEKIKVFEARLTKSLPVIPAKKPIDLAAVAIKNTDQKFDLLIKKVGFLSMLQTMHYYSGIQGGDSSAIFYMLDDLSQSEDPSLWKIYMNEYGDQISLGKKIIIGIFYLLLWKTGLLEIGIDAYLKHILNAVRTNIIKDGEKRNQFLNGFIEDIVEFFKTYNNATVAFANENGANGDLHSYREKATKETVEQRAELFKKLTGSIMKHLAPSHIDFGFSIFNYPINWIATWIVREQIVPMLLGSTFDTCKEQFKKENIPFFLNLTQSLTIQIKTLQETLKNGDPGAPGGSRKFDALSEQILRSLGMANCNTVEEVQVALERLKNKELFDKGEDRLVKFLVQKDTLIHLVMDIGLNCMYDQFAVEENLENLFATIFDSATNALSGHPPQDEEKLKQDFEKAKVEFRNTIENLTAQIIDILAENFVISGDSKPEVNARFANRIFQERKEKTLKTMEEMETISTQILNETGANKIYSQIQLLVSHLKTLKIREQKLLDKDSPIEFLTSREKEALKRSLYPLYNEINLLMERSLEMQAVLACYMRKSQTRKIRQFHGQNLKEIDLQIETDKKDLENLAQSMQKEITNLKTKTARFEKENANRGNHFRVGGVVAGVVGAFFVPAMAPQMVVGGDMIGALASRGIKQSASRISVFRAKDRIHKAYDLLWNDVVFNGALQIGANQVVALFP